MAKATRRKKETAPAVETVEELDEEDAFEELDDDADDDTEDTGTDETDEDEDSDEDDDLEELEEADEEPEEKPKAKGKKAKSDKAPAKKSADAPAFGSAELAAHITETTGQSYDARSVRMLLRKLAKTEGSPLQRAVGEDRARYSFTGPTDPAVKAIVQMVKSGEAQAIKRAGLDAVKEKANAKKTAAAAVVEEVEEAPAKKVKKAKKTATPAAPAKASASKKAKKA